MKDVHLKLRPQETDQPGIADPYTRLRKVLKEFLRRHGFRCIDYREAEPAEPLKDQRPEGEP